DLTVPLSLPPQGVTPETFVESLAAVLVEAYKLPPQEALYFASKLFVYLTSCDERRLGQWDYVSWKDFIREDRMSAEYRTVASRSLVRNLAATKADQASTHAIGLVGEASMMSLMGRGNDHDATFDRVLDGPTSEVWLDSWTELLQRLGVVFRVGWTLESLRMEGGRISNALVSDGAQTRPVTADWFIAAIPLERMAALLTPEMLAADPRLAGITRLKTDWMSGLQLYLREPLPLTNGHVNYVNSPFALTSISQSQFWERGLAGYGDGTVKESFSTIISDWDTPGIVFGKAARELTPAQIAREVFAQIQAHLNKDGRPVLRDDMLHSWLLDPAIRPLGSPGTPGVVNDTPLFIQDPGEWSNRPESVTAIPNLFLAGDWVRTHINVTTMDGANQGGRQAANGVLKAAGSENEPAKLWPLYEPPEYQPYRLIDRTRYEQGLPNLFDPDQAPPGRR
ncbi:MAG TPA: FAD-dependent oxidoreductase, partial [Candidatus Dormibacteraeota bacterium]|nr:FAD-dependent oxidoreductase [Candidatus Dormibacteraeota bacterium]